MQIAYSFDEIKQSGTPFVLTIGNFDGVHLGHQAVLARLVETAKQHQAKSAVLTFSNHPSSVLRPNHPTTLLCTVKHKLSLLENAGVDLVVMLPFTKSFSEQSADLFLHSVIHKLPFQILILGSDAHIGKNREGDASTVTVLAKNLGFEVEYFPDRTINGQRISSSLIREYIQQGLLKKTENLLGRPYSICGDVMKGHGRGASMGFPTANLDINGLCIPPLGVYATSLMVDGKDYPGVANLGLAPTVRKDLDPILEVHLFDGPLELYEKTVDVRFHDFIRQEKKFEGLEALRTQIPQDILAAKIIHQRNAGD